MQRHIILIGKPGSGKGTLANKITSGDTDYRHLSTGDVFRQNMADNTELGIEIQDVMNSGEFVNDELTIAVVEDWMSRHPNKAIIFDGFPRTESQFVWLINHLFDEEQGTPILLQIQASDKMVIDRIVKRSKEQKRQEDNDISKIKRRLQDYQNMTSPIISMYDQMSDDKIVVDGEQKIEKVYKQALIQIEIHNKN